MEKTLDCSTPSTEENGRGSGPAAWIRNVDLRLSLVRGPARLPWRGGSSTSADELPASEILGAARAVAGRPGAFLIGGGDPLRRADLAALLGQLSEIRAEQLGLCTTGEGLTTDVVHRLRAAGVRRVAVPFHCARQDAHDWLVGEPGALKTARRAIGACVDTGMPVVAEVVVTRPTMPHLAETVDVLTRVGVRTICLRRLTALDASPAEFVGLSPRLSLLGEDLERAATVALQRRARLVIRDFPVCVAPRLRRLFAAPDGEVWINMSGAEGAAGSRLERGPGCPGCPGDPVCGGAPSDYVARFGWEEFADATGSAVRMGEDVAAQQGVQPAGTMVFSWRGPRRVRCEACADDDRRTNPEWTRVVRARLVDAARWRPAVLRVVGAEVLAHRAAAALLYDAVRLFPRVEVAGEASAVVGWADVDFRRLKELARVDVALYGPDAASHDAHCGIPGSFAATLRGVERLREASIAVGAYAIVHDGRAARAFADAWTRGELPGPPRFRLSARGDSLDELVGLARELAPGAVRAALLAVLPRCACESADVAVDGGTVEPAGAQFSVAFGRRIDGESCGSDPVGTFVGCVDGEPCAVSGCAGTALGWQRSTRSERWMQDN